MACALWEAMRESWTLPDLATVTNTGNECLLDLLDKCTELQRLVILMTFWLALHCMNKVTHHKPAPPTERSRRFLNNYIESLLCIKKKHPQRDLVKGQMVVQSIPHVVKQTVPSPKGTLGDTTWENPPAVWAKLNVDGSYVHGENPGGVGMVLRDNMGAIIFSSCRFYLSSCSPMEVVGNSSLTREGTSLAVQRTEKPFIIELDCKAVVDALMGSSVNRSSLTSWVEEMKRAVHGIRRHSFADVRRSANSVAPCLAHRGRTTQRMIVWLGSLRVMIFVIFVKTSVTPFLN
ncbi:retrotransposon unclassified [Hordeum vulgare]|nr:retrotransposon unclassified [Hordeum vulgare]